MDKDNPAVYECLEAKGKSKLHYWVRNSNGTATCYQCGLDLKKYHADQVFSK